MVDEDVLFTPQWATLAEALHRRIGAIAKGSCGVSYLGLCLLASVCSHGGELLLAQFPCGALANDNTVVAVLNGLARRGLVEKGRSRNDRRVVLLTETEAGRSAVLRGFADIYDYLAASVWRNQRKANIQEIMDSFQPVLDRFGIDGCETKQSCHQVLTPSYLMAVAGILRLWTRCIADFSSLAFTEYRCLAALQYRLQPLSCATLAEGLLLDRSSVSPVVTRLEYTGLVRVSQGNDRRLRLVALTEKGEVAIELVSARLNRATAEVFCGVDPLLKARTNELHMRMYAALLDGEGGTFEKTT